MNVLEKCTMLNLRHLLILETLIEYGIMKKIKLTLLIIANMNIFIKGVLL